MIRDSASLQEDDALLTAREAAALLGMSPATMYRWSCYGRVPTVKVGRMLRFRRSELLQLLVDRPAIAGVDHD